MYSTHLRQMGKVRSNRLVDLCSAFAGCSASLAAAIAQEVPGAVDPGCPDPSCCQEYGYASSCSSNGFWTFAYCCARGGAADCYRWGEDSPGHDLEVHVAHSAVMCRHLCQSHEKCEYWSYLVSSTALDESIRGKCFLKNTSAVNARVKAHPYVVSGPRVCGHFGEGLTDAEAQARTGLRIDVSWSTAVSPASAKAASAMQNLRSAAGSAEWYKDAAEAISTLGFIVVMDALLPHQVAELRQEAETIAERMLALDPSTVGNRGPRRYSFGGASRTLHMMHMPSWGQLLDVDAIHRILKEVYPQGYYAAGGGGDFVLNRTSTYQSLHLDVGGPVHELGHPVAIGVNYVLQDLSCADGPLRVVPGSQNYLMDPPDLISEPLEMKHAVICPLPAGSAIVRDLRVWHGGTPNGSDRTRYLPNAEFVSHIWGQLNCGTGQILDPCQPVLPETAYDKFSEHARGVAAGIVDRSGVVEQAMKSGEWLLTEFPSFQRHQHDSY
eukprot:TRINITY_DN32309_c0_g1_i2.p1 TRINITY_DN32309_c0_g1~~TRINITY_DN32309_c0_g1_i2.p1  ORF type:complete len:495 (+),score=80.17 TRINITY_DN32309_c0_g1_i2:138-1622(+)